ncbi:MAG: NosD domain-containing protein, partial [Methanobacteriota archaeon]
CTAQNNLVGFLFSSATNVTCTNCNAYKQEGLQRRGPSGYQISDCNLVSIINSSAESNKFDGIYLKDSPNAQIFGNSLSSNDIAGIAIISKGAVIRENTISLNKAGGILVYGNNSLISKNHIISNKGRGLALDGSAQSRIWDNIFNNTKNIEITGNNPGTVLNVTPLSDISITGTSPTGGNYWGTPVLTGFSDSCTMAADGFCSALFSAGPNNTDFHPLVRPGYQSEAIHDISPSNISILRDINQNGRYEQQDVVELMKRISCKNYSGIEYDFSGDGLVNLKDVIILFDMNQNE